MSKMGTVVTKVLRRFLRFFFKKAAWLGRDEIVRYSPLGNIAK